MPPWWWQKWCKEERHKQCCPSCRTGKATCRRCRSSAEHDCRSVGWHGLATAHTSDSTRHRGENTTQHVRAGGKKATGHRLEIRAARLAASGEVVWAWRHSRKKSRLARAEHGSACAEDDAPHVDGGAHKCTVRRLCAISHASLRHLTQSLQPREPRWIGLMFAKAGVARRHKFACRSRALRLRRCSA